MPDNPPTVRIEEALRLAVELRAALIELQSASWARSWKRVQKARKRVKDLLGFDVPGPLKEDLDT